MSMVRLAALAALAFSGRGLVNVPDQRARMHVSAPPSLEGYPYLMPTIFNSWRPAYSKGPSGVRRVKREALKRSNRLRARGQR